MIVLGSAASALADPAGDVRDAVNRIRANAGLRSVELDPSLTEGCMKHTEYLRLNEGNPAIAGLRAHDEQPDLPGASDAGADCGKASDLAFEQTDVADAVSHGWIAGIYHRRPMLDPTLVKIGVGYAKKSNGRYIVALRFGKFDGKRGAWPVRYPADHQRDVPFEFGGETPRPVPKLPAGYPITLQFPPFDPVTDVSATLTDDSGHVVEAYAADPEHPATSFPQLGIVSIIAKHPLAPDTTYVVTIDATWRGQRDTWKWQFTTLALRPLDASDQAAVMAALGVPSRVHGIVTQAGTIDHGRTVYLQLGKGERMISVIMSLAVWRELAGNANPQRWVHRTIEVAATPQPAGDKFINFTVSAADQVRSK